MFRYILASVEQITPSTIRLTLEPDPQESKIFSFHQGQYGAISFVKKNGLISPARCFSIVSSPSDQTKLQFSMRVRGRFTTALSKLEPGTKMHVHGPFGGFVFDTTRHKEALFVAGGIGITPFMSMASYLAMIEFPNKVELLYGLQNQDDIPFLDELKEIESKNHNFSVNFVVAEGEHDKLSGQKVSEGRITPEILSKSLGDNPTNKTVFICGPPPFMKAVIDGLKSSGVPADNIVTEVFNQGKHHQAGKIMSWPRNMYAINTVGVLALTVFILGTTIIKSLPKNMTFNDQDDDQINQLSAQNNRTKDLDSLVNSLKSNITSRTTSPTAEKAINEANAAIAANAKASQTQSSAPSTTTTTKTTTQSSATAQPAPVSAPVATPAPPPQPVCTTTQSGVTTCQ